jgi:transposase
LRNNRIKRLPEIENHVKKKTTSYKEQDPQKVAEYNEKIKEVPKDKRVYVDEAGFDTYLFRKYARSPRGQKVYEAVKGKKYHRTSIVAGKLGHKIIAPLEYNGTMHGEFFEVWFEKHLIPSLSEDTVIILDNASFHRKKRLYEIAECHKRKIIFLPPYSPELNPIEHFWHWLKKTTADTLRSCSDLRTAIFEAFQLW